MTAVVWSFEYDSMSDWLPELETITHGTFVRLSRRIPILQARIDGLVIDKESSEEGNDAMDVGDTNYVPPDAPVVEVPFAVPMLQQIPPVSVCFIKVVRSLTISDLVRQMLRP